MKSTGHFALAALLIPCLLACSPADEPPPTSAATAQTGEVSSTASVSPEEALNQYADELVASNTSDFSGHEPAVMTSSGRPLAYVLTFQTKGTNYLIKKNISDNDRAGYESNLKITNQWQATYCTGALKSLMRSHGIFSAGGHVVDSRGQKHSIAICTV